MARLSQLLPPALPLSGLELLPALQGGGEDGNIGLPILSIGAPFGGQVLVMRAPVLADLSATADADPGAGKVRWNHATPASATQIYIDDVDEHAADLAAALAALQSGGFLYFQGRADSDARDNWQKWQVTIVVDASGYTKLAVTLQASNGTFADGDELEMILQQPVPSPGVDRNVVTTLSSSSGVVTVDLSLGDYFALTPTEDITSWSFTNEPAAYSINIVLTQGATPYAVAVPAGLKWAGGAAGAFSTAANKVDEINISSTNAGGTRRAVLAKDFT